MKPVQTEHSEAKSTDRPERSEAESPARPERSEAESRGRPEPLGYARDRLREAESRQSPFETDVPASVDARRQPVTSSLHLSALIYFALTGGATILAALGLRWGLPGSAVLIGTGGLAIAITAALERFLPYRTAWQRSHDDVRTDLTHLFVTNGLAIGGRWFNAAAVTALNVSSAGAISLSLWPTGWPLLAQLALALGIQELCGYWIHRAQHEIPLLWKFHSVHHSAPRLYWLNQMRNHPIDAMISGWALVPVVILGAPDQVLIIFGALTAVHLMLQHANIDIRLGPFNWVLSSSEVHRWHHSRRIEESNSNYGGVLLIWDVLFRTRFAPIDRQPPEKTGLSGSDAFPQDYFGQLAAPFSPSLWKPYR